RLADHLEDYFDTPAHALFVVYIITNPICSEGKERATMAEVARNVIGSLQKHSELFNGSDQSESLALALMRASIYMGDTQSALLYSQKIPSGSKTAETPEFNWMVAVCRFLQKQYEEAEGPLLKVVRSRDATARELGAATRGLI